MADRLNTGTDGDGLLDGEEDADKSGMVGRDEMDTRATGAEDYGMLDGGEVNGHTDPLDDDTDNDGLLDGTEDASGNGVVDMGETDPTKADSDGDGLQDGTEVGLTMPEGNDTDGGVFIADADPTTKTDPLDT